MRCLIGELIIHKGFKKKYIAKEIGVTETTFSGWINNHYYPPVDKAFKIADLLGCKVDDLYERNEKAN